MRVYTSAGGNSEKFHNLSFCKIGAYFELLFTLLPTKKNPKKRDFCNFGKRCLKKWNSLGKNPKMTNKNWRKVWPWMIFWTKMQNLSKSKLFPIGGKHEKSLEIAKPPKFVKFGKILQICNKITRKSPGLPCETLNGMSGMVRTHFDSHFRFTWENCRKKKNCGKTV